MNVLALAAALAIASAAALPAARAAESHCIVPELGLPLAGPDAVDCGVAEEGKPFARRRVVACARKAIARGKPVRFGVGVMGTDAFWCDVVAVDADLRYWKLEFDWDLSIDPGEPSAFVGRCPTIDLDWRDSGGTGRFGPLDCVHDADAFLRAKIRRP